MHITQRHPGIQRGSDECVSERMSVWGVTALAIPARRAGPRAGPAGAARPPYRSAWCRWPSGPTTAAARSGSPPASAGWWASNLPTGGFRCGPPARSAPWHTPPLSEQMAFFFGRYDLLLTPTIPVPPFDAGREVPAGWPHERWMSWTPFTYPFNLTQQPAGSVPCGFTPGGLPSSPGSARHQAAAHTTRCRPYRILRARRRSLSPSVRSARSDKDRRVPHDPARAATASDPNRAY